MTTGTQSLTGLWPPVATPFAADGSVDLLKLVRHSRALIEAGATGLAILGTTSEANSLTLRERHAVIDAHIEAGIEPRRLLPGTGACAIDDVVELTRHAGEAGVTGVLLLPPFYYKGVSDDGLFAFVAAVIERAGPRVPPIMLYHIPPMAAVGWSHALITRLREAFPGLIIGMKDSSGDAEHTRQTIEAFPGFAVFPGSEVYLLQALTQGARGCISASANINARAIAHLIRDPKAADGAAQQTALNAVRAAVQSRGLIPAIKGVLAARYGDDTWLNVRPPLMRLSAAALSDLYADVAVHALSATSDRLPAGAAA
jgi:4-hydroxy-tetrahydrodipicolinate synthase